LARRGARPGRHQRPRKRRMVWWQSPTPRKSREANEFAARHAMLRSEYSTLLARCSQSIVKRGVRIRMTHNVLIRPAVMSERQALESLQRRASLNNPGDREALLANPDAIELPPDQIAVGQVFIEESDGAIVGFSDVLHRKIRMQISTDCC